MRMTRRRSEEDAPTEIDADAYLRPGVATSAGSDETVIDRVAGQSARTLRFGDVLDNRYRLEEPIGRSPVGQIFRGQMLSLRLRVTIHLFDRALTTRPLFRERIRRETATVAAVQHRHLGRIVDFVDGEPTFLVVEHIGGRSVAQALADEGPLEWSRAARIVADVASAVAALHANGAAHGHIEPANVVLVDDGEGGEDVRLVGLGIAGWQATSGDAWTRNDLVAWHDLGGGDQEEAIAEDLRRLGGLLHELVHGQRAPRHDGAGGELPDELYATVERARCTKPTRRFASARELAEALRQILRDRASAMPRPKRPRIAGWLVLAAILACLAATAAFWLARMTAHS
jgi:serine/threonine-protein kinase